MIITTLITIGIFGGLLGGPVAILADYYASPQKRLWLFRIPEFVGFGCMGLMIIYGRSGRTQFTF